MAINDEREKLIDTQDNSTQDEPYVYLDSMRVIKSRNPEDWLYASKMAAFILKQETEKN